MRQECLPHTGGNRLRVVKGICSGPPHLADGKTEVGPQVCLFSSTSLLSEWYLAPVLFASQWPSQVEEQEVQERMPEGSLGAWQ